MTKLNHLYTAMKSNTRDEGKIVLQSHQPLGNSTYKVVAALSRPLDEAEFEQAFAESVDNYASYIPNTLSIKGRTAVAIVRANRPSRVMDSSFKQVTSETASDSNGQLWAIKQVNGQKHVVLESNDDLEELFAKRCATRKVVASAIEMNAISAVASVRNGDFVKFINTTKQKAEVGFAFNVGGSYTVFTASGDNRKLDKNTVLVAVPRSSIPEKLRAPVMSTAALDASEYAKVIAMLRKAFGEDSTGMLAKLAQMVGISLPAAAA